MSRPPEPEKSTEVSRPAGAGAPLIGHPAPAIDGASRRTMRWSPVIGLASLLFATETAVATDIVSSRGLSVSLTAPPGAVAVAPVSLTPSSDIGPLLAPPTAEVASPPDANTPAPPAVAAIPYAVWSASPPAVPVPTASVELSAPNGPAHARVLDASAEPAPPPGPAGVGESGALTPVRFDVGRPLERWVLTEANRTILCELPCIRLVPPDAELRLRRVSPAERHPPVLNVPNLDADADSHAPLHAKLVKNKLLAAEVGYIGVGGGITLLSAVVGQLSGMAVTGSHIAQQRCGASSGLDTYAACAVSNATNIETATAGSASKGLLIGLGAGAVLGSVVGTIIYLAWHPMKVGLAPEGE